MRGPEREALLRTLKARFETHPHRHEGIAWSEVQARLDDRPDALRSLHMMESTGGEPDVIGREALDSRKEHRPAGSTVERAAAMGIELLSEAQYRALQGLGEFDCKTSSWILTPPDIRALGGALYCDRRYGRVFVYHNGAQSYYAVRGFRGALRA